MTIARVPSLVVTLGTLYIIRGIDGAWAGGNQVNASMLPERLQQDRVRHDRRCAVRGIIAIVGVAVATYAMRSFRTTRDLYAIGSDPDDRELAGIPVGSARVPRLRPQWRDRRAGRGRSWLSLLRVRRCDRGRRLEFQVIAAVVVGGVAIFGGSGTVLGAALGALLLNTINSALVVAERLLVLSQAIAGGLLIGAITLAG